jgi:hypothetical protein
MNTCMKLDLIFNTHKNNSGNHLVDDLKQINTMVLTTFRLWD